MRELPEGFSVVSAIEFEMLSHLPEFERRAEGLVRVDDPEQFVLPQSEWDRHEDIRKPIEMECAALDACIPSEQGSTEMGRLLAIEPNVVAAPETREQAEYRRLFIDPPNHPETNRPPSWHREPIDPFGGR